MSDFSRPKFRSKTRAVIESVQPHGGGNGSAVTTPELAPELRPLFSGSVEELLNFQQQAPLTPYNESFVPGQAGLSPYEQYGMGLSVGGEMPGGLEALALQNILRSPEMAAAGPTTGQANFSGEPDLRSLTMMLQPTRGALGDEAGGIKGSPGGMNDRERMPVERADPRPETRVVGPRGAEAEGMMAPSPQGAEIPGGNEFDMGDYFDPEDGGGFSDPRTRPPDGGVPHPQDDGRNIPPRTNIQQAPGTRQGFKQGGATHFKTVIDPETGEERFISGQRGHTMAGDEYTSESASSQYGMGAPVSAEQGREWTHRRMDAIRAAEPPGGPASVGTVAAPAPGRARESYTPEQLEAFGAKKKPTGKKLPGSK